MTTEKSTRPSIHVLAQTNSVAGFRRESWKGYRSRTDALEAKRSEQLRYDTIVAWSIDCLPILGPLESESAWIASAELVDAIPAGDLHGPTYDQLLRSAAEDSYEAERRLRFKDGDWTPETYAPHRAALERYYELYKLAPAWCRVIAGSAA